MRQAALRIVSFAATTLWLQQCSAVVLAREHQSAGLALHSAHQREEVVHEEAKSSLKDKAVADLLSYALLGSNAPKQEAKNLRHRLSLRGKQQNRITSSWPSHITDKGVPGIIAPRKPNSTVLSKTAASHHVRHILMKTNAQDHQAEDCCTEAIELLSGMLRKTIMGLDVEESRCQQYDEASVVEIGNVRDILAQDQSRLALIETSISEGMLQHDNVEAEHHEYSNDLQSAVDDCNQTTTEMDARLRLLQEDLDALTRAYDSSPCSEGTVGLLQCTHTGKRRSLNFITFQSRTMRRTVASLRSPIVRTELQKALNEVYGEYVDFPEEPTARSTARSRSFSLARARSHLHKKKSKICTVVRRTACSEVEEAMIMLYAQVQDKQQEFKAKLAATQQRCEMTKSDLGRQLYHLASRRQQLQINLATAIAEHGALQEEIHLKHQELTGLADAQHKMKMECAGSIDVYLSEEHDLKRSRVDLYAAAGQQVPAFQDCEVSPWIAGNCSEPCGGGEQLLTREVIVPAGPQGIACLPLQMRQSCNALPCPIDCEVSEWSEWSDCSSMCDTGMRTRMRTILKHAQHGGTECPLGNAENEACNKKACDEDCVLSEWSVWSTCSRPCGGGFEHRLRQITEHAIGNGFCATEDDRTEYRSCNKEGCPSVPPQGTPSAEGNYLRCDSALDLVIIMDGTSNMGPENFELQRTFVKSLLGALTLGEDKAQVALILANGPTSLSGYNQCMTGVSETACQVHLASPLSADAAALGNAVPGLTVTSPTTYVAGALSMASNLLINGRQDFQSTVLVILYENTLSDFRTSSAAANLMQQARVLWVLVGRDVPTEKVKSWASRPLRDNILVFETFEALVDSARVADVLAAVCPVVLPFTPLTTNATVTTTTTSPGMPQILDHLQHLSHVASPTSRPTLSPDETS